MKRWARSWFVGLGLSLSAGGAAAEKKVAQALPSEQWLEFRYTVQIPKIKKADLPLKIFVPLAPSSSHQSVLTRDIRSSDTVLLEKASIARESVYGNEYWALAIDAPREEPSQVTFDYKILRRTKDLSNWAEATKATYQPNERQDLALYLKADRRVPVDGELVQKLRAELPKSAETPLAKARAIYDYVLANMEYKKVGSGWGNGDTLWACTEKYGNCTDFHALYTSLSRAEGIPTRFEIGFPIPEEKTAGDIKGYHCWIEAYLPQLAWFPIDASEAKKHPAKRELFFGTQPPDRIVFSTGRDLVLGDMPGTPINFFIYPHVLRGDKKVDNLITTQFAYRLLKPEELKAAL